MFENYSLISVGIGFIFFYSMYKYRGNLLFVFETVHEFNKMIYPLLHDETIPEIIESKNNEIVYIEKYWDLFEKTSSNFELSNDEYKNFDTKFVCKINEYTQSMEYKALLDNMVLYEDTDMCFVSNDEIEWSIPESKKEKIIQECHNEIIDTKIKLLKHNLLFENTPFGNVCMSYDSEGKTFIYYCDKCLPNEVLNTVARKYVCTYKCKPLYVLKTCDEPGYQEEKEKKKEEIKEEEEVKEEKEKKPNVFAKLKSYNQRKTEIKKENIEKPMNRFIYKGKMTNYDLLKTEERNTEKLTFTDYKKLKNL